MAEPALECMGPTGVIGLGEVCLHASQCRLCLAEFPGRSCECANGQDHSQLGSEKKSDCAQSGHCGGGCTGKIVVMDGTGWASVLFQGDRTSQGYLLVSK